MIENAGHRLPMEGERNMSAEFVELLSTDNQRLFVRKDAVAALEPVSPSARVEGHIKLYMAGYKFLIQGEIGDLLKKLTIEVQQG